MTACLLSLNTHHVREVEIAVGWLVDSQTHDVGYGGVQEPSLGGRQERDEDVRPGEGEEESCGAVTDEHQLLVVCGRWGYIVTLDTVYER